MKTTAKLSKKIPILFLAFLAFGALLFVACAKETKVVKVEEKPAGEMPAINETQAENATQPTTGQQPSQPSDNDLSIDKLLLSTVYPDVGETFEVKVTIANNGRKDIVNFEYSIEIYKGSDIVKQDRQTYSGTINKSASIKITREYSLAEIGSYEVIAKIDPSNAIAEFDEANNEKSATLTVTATSNVTQVTNKTSTSTSGLCTDSDGGKTYNVKGTCAGKNAAGLIDVCIESTLLWEWYCDAYDNCQHIERTCRCKEGICIS